MKMRKLSRQLRHVKAKLCEPPGTCTSPRCLECSIFMPMAESCQNDRLFLGFGNVLWKPHLRQHAKITGTTRHMHIHMEKAKWWAQTRFHTPLVLLKTNHGGRGGHTLDTNLYYASSRWSMEAWNAAYWCPWQDLAKMTDFLWFLARCSGQHTLRKLVQMQNWTN